MCRICIRYTDLSKVFQICSRNGVLALIVAEVIMGWLASRLTEIADLAAAICRGTILALTDSRHCSGTKAAWAIVACERGGSCLALLKSARNLTQINVAWASICSPIPAMVLREEGPLYSSTTFKGRA